MNPKPARVDAPDQRAISRHPVAKARERGAALILLVVTIALLAAGTAASLFTAGAVTALSDGATANALGFARDALISYATTRGGPTGTARPGEFPCPDTNNDGREDLNPASVPAGACMAGLGRIPWITLGIPEPKDSAGETLWYAVGLPFRNSASNPNPINSDTLGNLTVRVGGSTTPITTRAVAVVLAPGEALPAQNRSAGGSVSCGGTGMAPNLCASNYLEAYGGVDNASANGPFISVSAAGVSGFNDRLTYIGAADFIPAIEQRVGAELQDAVEQYRRVANVYPWAADFAAATGLAVVGVNRGRFPLIALPFNWNTTIGGTATPRLPSWIGANNWHNVVYYSAGRGQLDPASPCTTCSASATLSVTDASGAAAVSAVLLTPGTPAAGVTRPSTALTSYLEDAQNNHASLTCTGASVATACDAYVAPAATRQLSPGLELPLTDRDRIFPITTDAVTCSQAAATLAGIARTTTCGGPGNSVIAACKTTMSQIAKCGCKAAANAMIKPPCYNVSNNANLPKQCSSALTQLDVCS